MTTEPQRDPAYAEPVRYHEETGAYVVTGFEEAASVLRNPGWSSDPHRSPKTSPGMPDRVTAALVFMDPPDHTRLRRLLSPIFTPRAIETLRPRVAAIADAAVGALEDGSDLISEVGHVVPLATMAELLDVGSEGAELFYAETPRLCRLLEVGARAEDLLAAGGAATTVAMFLLPVIVARQSDPGDDLISAMLAIDGLTPDEVLTTCVQLLAGGHETTADLITNSTLALLRDPDQREHLFADPARAIEELLRVEGPARQVGRIALTDHAVGGLRIPEGSHVLVRIDAANRDPRRFPDPDRLDLTRPGPSNLAFSGGAHFCLGAALARLEATETLVRLFRRHPGLRMETDRLRWRSSDTFRGLSELPVRLGP
jgi:cytochrome P450